MVRRIFQPFPTVFTLSYNTLSPTCCFVCPFYKVTHMQLFFVFEKPDPRDVASWHPSLNVQIFGYPTGLGALIVKKWYATSKYKIVLSQ
jgi:hypothetical protein